MRRRVGQENDVVFRVCRFGVFCFFRALGLRVSVRIVFVGNCFKRRIIGVGKKHESVRIVIVANADDAKLFCGAFHNGRIVIHHYFRREENIFAVESG